MTLAGTTTTDEPAGPRAVESPWSPLRIRIFRIVWIASVVSNLGSWMHLVAAGWLMTSLTTSAALVALLQSASALPSFLLALPAGAMADVFDRRRLILVAQFGQLVVAAILGVVTLSGGMTPALLLGLTLLLGAASTAGLPAFSAITPELVGRERLTAAISLNSVATTATQAVGPALGGLLVASLGAGAVFLVNAASFLAVLVAIFLWRRTPPATTLPAEHVGAAVRTGLRYAANAPELLAVLARNFLYVVAYSVLPALLAIDTRVRLGGGAGAYGVLLGLLGAGGVAGALILPRTRQRLGSDRLVALATLNQIVVLLVVSSAHSLVLVAPFLFLAGIAGMSILSSLTIAAQEVLPAWVRGRGLAVYQLVFQLSYAGGAALWGALAASLGLAAALRIAAGTLVVGLVAGRWLGLAAADGVDVANAYRPEPYPHVDLEPDDGPILVQVSYALTRAPEPAVIRAVRQARRREGASQWSLYEDLASPGTWVEIYVARSFAEHQRQGERRTATDQAALDRFADAAGPERVTRYLIGR